MAQRHRLEGMTAGAPGEAGEAAEVGRCQRQGGAGEVLAWRAATQLDDAVVGPPHGRTG